MKLQGSGPSAPKSLQSQNRPRPENRLSISRLDVVHGQRRTQKPVESTPSDLRLSDDRIEALNHMVEFALQIAMAGVDDYRDADASGQRT